VKSGPTGWELAGLGGMLAGAVVVPMLIGLGIDSVAGSGPLFFLTGLGVGVVGAIVTGYSRFKRFL
jgi:hypothetical protein